MGKASSAKKVARAARAGGSRRAGQRRPLGFPLTVAAVVILGVLVVGFARNQRESNAKPEVGDHWHAAYGVYVCTAQPGTDEPATSETTTTTPESTTSSQTGARFPADAHLGVAQQPSSDSTTTTTTAPADSTTTTSAPAESTTTTTAPTTTTTLGPNDVPGEFLPPLNDAFEDANGIHTHGDNVMHIHPFNSSVAGRKATLDKFLTQVGVVLTDDTLTLPSGKEYKEGHTKCQGNGLTKDGIIQVAVWDKASDAANGSKPNKILTTDVTNVHLENGQAITIAFLPDGQAVPADNSVVSKLEELGALDTDSGVQSTTTTAPGESTTTAPTESTTSTSAPAESTTTTTAAGETTTTTSP